MGILYQFSPLYSYGDAALAAAAARRMIIAASWRKSGKQERQVTVE